MEILKRFSSLVTRLALALTAAACLGSSIFDKAIAQGILLGGLCGVLAFRILVRDTQVANATGDRVKSGTRTWLAARMVFYALVLLAGYKLDTTQLRGFFGAAAGLFMTRVSVMVVGVTGWDLKRPEQ